MKRFLINIAKYGMLAALTFNAVAVLCLIALGRSQFYKPSFISNGLDRRNYDYAVLGSSTGLTTIDTKCVDSVTGKHGVNISMDDSAISSHFLMLEHFLATGHTANTLILAVSTYDAAVPDPKINNNDYRFLPYIREDYVHNYYDSMEKSVFRPLAMSRYFPIAGVGYYNTELIYPAIAAAIKPKYRNRFDDKGNYTYPLGGLSGTYPEKIIPFKGVNPYLKKIETLCRARNIRLQLYLTPAFHSRAVPEDGRNYINHSDLLHDPKLFYDEIHVNAAGRRICSLAVADLLSGRQ